MSRCASWRPVADINPPDLWQQIALKMNLIRRFHATVRAGPGRRQCRLDRRSRLCDTGVGCSQESALKLIKSSLQNLYFLRELKSKRKANAFLIDGIGQHKVRKRNEEEEREREIERAINERHCTNGQGRQSFCYILFASFRTRERLKVSLRIDVFLSLPMGWFMSPLEHEICFLFKKHLA